MFISFCCLFLSLTCILPLSVTACSSVQGVYVPPPFPLLFSFMRHAKFFFPPIYSSISFFPLSHGIWLHWAFHADAEAFHFFTSCFHFPHLSPCFNLSSLPSSQLLSAFYTKFCPLMTQGHQMKVKPFSAFWFLSLNLPYGHFLLLSFTFSLDMCAFLTTCIYFS